MRKRVLALLRAQIAGEWFGRDGAKLPVAPFLFHASLSALMCGLARQELQPFAFGIFALSIPLALTSLPLLGELGPLLRRDPAAEWIGAQPVTSFERRAARVLLIAILLGGLALASLLPAAVIAPIDWPGSLLLIVTGLAQTAVIAAGLLWLQALFGERAESVLVLVQTLVFCAVIVGAVMGLRLIPALRALEAPDGALLAYPPAWFAAFQLANPLESAPLAVGIAVVSTLASIATFLLAPFPSATPRKQSSAPLAVLLAPIRSIATRIWVKRGERAVFDFVYEALPREREFVIRTYPLVAVPLAFMLMGASGEDVKGEGLLALLLFTPAMYLPVLLTFVPTTATPDARWLLTTAPLDPNEERSATQKAIFVRFLFPLFVGLCFVVGVQGDFSLVARVAPIALILLVFALRASWDLCVATPVLSTHPDEIGSAWGKELPSLLLTLAIGLTFVAIASWQWIESSSVSLGILAVALLWELVGKRRSRPSTASTSA